jgi:dipeptidyl aminopeptidase/acylaminoacyl peptidase
MTRVPVEPKEERQGWPSLARPDYQPPPGWNLPLLTAVQRIHHHALSPDGQQFYVVRDTVDGLADLYQVAVAGGWPVRLTADRAAVPYWWDTAPRPSPDGNWLAYVANGHVVVSSMHNHTALRITDFAPGGGAPVWFPDSAQLLVSVEHRELTRLFITDRNGAWPRPLAGLPGDEEDPTVAPDGRRVVFVLSPRADLNRSDLVLVELETGEQRTLIGSPGIKHLTPRYGPHGRIAFLTDSTGWHEIWLINEDGSHKQQLTHIGRDISDIAWSPDGRNIACCINRDGAMELALVDAQNGEVRTLRGGPGCHSRPCWAPDGSYLTVEYESPFAPPDLFVVQIDGTARQVSFSNTPALAVQDLVMPERVSYKSYDGLEIPALLYRPATPNGAAIVYPHGGPRDQYYYEWDIFAQYLVAKGYTYLCPDYRGSTGHGKAFAMANQDTWGVGDMHDCLRGADYLAGLPGIDKARIGIYGGSYGGYMVACCLARDPLYRYACGVYKYGDAHLFSSWAQCERSTRLYTEMQMGHPTAARSAYREASPIFEAHQIKRPVLIVHGLDDDVCPPQSTEEWVEALRKAGVTFEYKTYPGVAHGFIRRADQLDLYGRIERFLDWYLL